MKRERNLLKILIIAYIIIFVPLIIFIVQLWPKTATEDWSITIEGEYNGRALSMKTDTEDNIIMAVTQGEAGYSKIISLLKYDSLGNLLWNETWGEDKGDYIFDIEIGSNNYIYCAGSKEGYIYIAKYDQDGKSKWHKTLNNEAYGRAIEIDEQGNIVVICDDYDDLYVYKFESSGNELWNATYTHILPDFYDIFTSSLKIDSNDDLYISGYNWKYDSFNFLLKLDSDGNAKWNRTIDLKSTMSYQKSPKLTIDNDDNIYLMCEIGSNSTLKQYNSQGDEIWSEVFFQEYDDLVPRQILKFQEKIYIVGDDSSILMFSLDGKIENNFKWKEDFQGDFFDISIDKEGNIYILGLYGGYEDSSLDNRYGSLIILKNPRENDGFAIFLVILLFILLIGSPILLVFLNFYLNYKKSEERRTEKINNKVTHEIDTKLSKARELFREIEQQIKEGDEKFSLKEYKVSKNHYKIALNKTKNVKGLEEPQDKKMHAELLTDLIEAKRVLKKLESKSNIAMRTRRINSAMKRVQSLKAQIRDAKTEVFREKRINMENSIKSKIKKTNLKIREYEQREARLEQERILSQASRYPEKINNLRNQGKYEQGLAMAIKARNLLTTLPIPIEENKLEQAINNQEDNIHMELIENKLVKVKEAINNGEVNQAHHYLHYMKGIIKKILNPETRESSQKKYRYFYNSVISREIIRKFREVAEFKMSFAFDAALEQEPVLNNLYNEMFESDLKNEMEKKIRRTFSEIRIIKIKETILSLGSNYARLEIREIAEECGESAILIATTIKEMIESEEIYARYFESSKAVSFNQQKILQNLEKLKKFANPAIIAEGPKICVVCRGNINYFLYECPKCNALYHLKCAKAIKEQNKGCFSCQTNFPPLPDMPKTIKDDPKIISVKNIATQVERYLNPLEIMHKDHSQYFLNLKHQLKEELTHKVSNQFYEGFRNQIDNLFQRFVDLDEAKLEQLADLKEEQSKMFQEINDQMEEFIIAKHRDYIRQKVICPHCNKEILKEENQKICEYCGGSLEDE